jgi:hypothetical protein
MRKFRKVAAAIAATGLVALGAVAAAGGGASAATARAAGPAVTRQPGPPGPPAPGSVIPMGGCIVAGPALLAGPVVGCISTASTADNPTSITVTVDPEFFRDLFPVRARADVDYRLSCLVDGQWVTSRTDRGFHAFFPRHNFHVINLLRAVGSPAPNQCVLADLTVTTDVGPVILGAALRHHRDFALAVFATAVTAEPGAIFRTDAKNANGATPSICADVKGNGNAGTPVQVWSCNSGLAQLWIRVSSGQVVHNGDCLDDVGGSVFIQPCVKHLDLNSTQVWTSTPVNTFGYTTLVNRGTNGCLTAASPANGTPLTVTPCTGAANQMWKVPGVTPGI